MVHLAINILIFALKIIRRHCNLQANVRNWLTQEITGSMLTKIRYRR